ncbi:nucleoside triphosphate pyrophosphohydrolase [Verrucomicrobiota bacterium]
MNDHRNGTERLLWVVDRLRDKGGCPWDREQTLESLKQYLIEESYEVIDAIDSGDVDKHKEELGDVLLQVALQSRIRKEKKEFTFNDVAEKLADKLIRRHPHVFGDTKASDSKTVLQNWEKIKANEKNGGKQSVLEGVPRHLPALQKAQRVQSRASRVGFDWTRVTDVTAKIDEELSEVREAIDNGDIERIKEETGDLLFAVVNLARFQNINAEEVLRNTVNKFIDRFKEVERRIYEEGRSLQDSSLEEMDAHWEAVKKGEH